MDRSNFFGGPAFLTWNGATFQMEDDWKADDEIKVFDVNTNLQGRVDQREDEISTKITFKALGLFASIAKLMPYQPNQIGSLVFPSVDLPAVVQTKDGKSITYSAAGITKQASLRLSATNQLIGEAELTCLRKNNTAGDAVNAHNVVATSAYTEPLLDPADIIIEPWDCEWGTSGPFSDLDTEDGFTFEPVVTMEPRKNDRDGLLNYRITAVEATVKFKPVNADVVDYYSGILMDGPGAGRGSSLQARAQELVLTGSVTGNILTIPAAAIPKGGLRFSQKDNRVNEVTFAALRTSVSGVLQPLFTLVEA